MAEAKTSISDWMNKHWRPAMAWVYLITIIADFIVFPVLWGIGQALTHATITQWDPLTLKSAGFFHLTMAAVLGIAAYGRTQEKLAGVVDGITAVKDKTNGDESDQK